MRYVSTGGEFSGWEPFGLSLCIEAFPPHLLYLGIRLHSIRTCSISLLDSVYRIILCLYYRGP